MEYNTETRRKISKAILSGDDEPTRMERDNLSNSMNNAFSSRVEEDESNREMFLNLNSELSGLSIEYGYMTGKEKPALHEEEYTYKKLKDSDESASLNPNTAQYEDSIYRDSPKLQHAAELTETTTFFEDISRTNSNPEPERPARYDKNGMMLLKNSAYFNGTSSYLDLGNDTYDFTGTNSFTISAWVRYESSGSDDYIIKLGNTEISLYKDASENFVIFINTDSGNFTNSLNATNELFVWTHLCATYDGSELILYKDGVANTPTSVSANIANASGQDLIGSLFSGHIADVKIWNKELSSIEVKRLYEQRDIITVPYNWPSNENLIAYYPAHDDLWLNSIKNADFIELSDFSGNNYNGDVYGNLLNFDGTDDFVEILEASELKFSSSEAFTKELWLRLDDNTGNNVQILHQQERTHIGIDQSTTYSPVSNGIYSNIAGTATGTEVSVSIGEWYHVAIVYDNTNLKIYVNGNIEAENTVTLENQTGSNLYYGNSAVSGGYPFDGILAEMRIWNVARTKSEIQNNMHSTLTGSESNLVAYYPTDEGSGTTTFDEAGTNDGAITSATWSKDKVSVNRLETESNSLIFGNEDIYIDASNFLSVNNDFTLSLWFYPDSNTQSIITKGTSKDAAANIDFDLYGDGTNLIASFSNGSSTDTVSTTFPSLNTWHHIIIQADHTNLELSLILNNGTPVTASITLDYTNSYNWYIGGSDITNGFDGKLKEIRFYNEILTSENIKNLYNNITLLDKNLLAYYSLNNHSFDAAINATNATETDITYGDGIVHEFIESKAALFNGFSSNVEIEASDSINHIFDNGGTISFWMKAYENSIIAYKEWKIYLENNYLTFDCDYGSWYANSLLSFNTIYSIIITFNSEELGAFPNIYINGKSADIRINDVPTATRIDDSNTNLYIGYYSFNGLLDDFRLYKRILPEDEAFDLYNIRNIPFTNIEGRYKFDNDCNDYSGKGNHGTPSYILYKEGLIPTDFETIFYPSEKNLSSYFLNIRDFYDNGGTGGNIPNATIDGEYLERIVDEPEENQLYMEIGNEFDSELENDLIVNYEIENDDGVNTDTLKAYYELNGNATDSSGNSYDGTENDILYTEGVAGSAASFNGTSSYISIGTDVIDFSGTNTFTISAWVRWNGGNSGTPADIVHLGSFEVLLNKTGGDNWMIYFYDGTSSHEIYIDASNDIDEWIHLCGVYDGTELILYRNGSAGIPEIISTNVNTSSGTDTIGARGGGMDRFFSGDIDEVRCFSNPLSQEEVLSLYKNSGPQTYTSTLIDATDNNNTGTLTNASLLNNSLFFNGYNAYVTIPDDSTIQNIFDDGSTISAWIFPKSDGEGDYGRIIQKKDGALGWNFTVSSEAGGYVGILFTYGFTINYGQWVSDVLIPINKWSYVEVYYNASSTDNDPIFYLNNEELSFTEGSTPDGTRTDDTGIDILIGNRLAYDRTFDGYIKDLRIFNKELTSAERNLLIHNYLTSFYMNYFDFKDNYILINPTDENNFAFGKILKCKSFPSRILFAPLAKKGTIPDNANFTKDFTKDDDIFLEALKYSVYKYEEMLNYIKYYLNNNPNVDKENNRKIFNDINSTLEAFEIWKEEADPTSIVAINTLLESIENIRQMNFPYRISYIKNYLITREESYEDRLDIIGWRINKLDGTLKEMMDAQIGTGEALRVYDRNEERKEWYYDYFIVKRVKEDGQYKRRLFIEDPNDDIQVGDWLYILTDDEAVPEIYAQVDLIVDGRLASYEDSSLDVNQGEINMEYKNVQKIFFKNTIFTARYKTEDYLRVIKQIE